MTDIVYNKNGIPFDIDALASDVNGKMDKDGVNATCPVVVSRTPNSQGGVVEIWSDGYCVQTGRGNFGGGNKRDEAIIITLPQSYKDTNYLVFLDRGNGAYFAKSMPATDITSVNTITVIYYATDDQTASRSSFRYSWRTEGYIR